MFKIQNKVVSYGQNMFRNGKTGRQLLLMPEINTTPYHDLLLLYILLLHWKHYVDSTSSFRLHCCFQV